MGDRVLVRFFGQSQASPAIYMHWGASATPDKLARFFESEPFTSRRGDVSYNFARFVALACNDCPGGLSVGVWNDAQGIREWLGDGDNSHGDGGLVAVNLSTGQIEARGGYLERGDHWDECRERLTAAGFSAPVMLHIPDSVLKVGAESPAVPAAPEPMAPIPEAKKGERPKIEHSAADWHVTVTESSGIVLADLTDRNNEPRAITSRQSPRRAYDIARKCWPDLVRCKTMWEASRMLGERGAKLHSYCAMD